MGGKALKTIDVRRCSKEEFMSLSSELVTILKKTFKEVTIPVYYKNKPDFGDIDIIISSSNITLNMRDFIQDTFSPHEIFHNGSCWSFDYKDIQIDLILAPDEHFATTLMYMGNSDLGNLVGRLAHSIGLKYGQEGLWMEHEFKGKNIGKVHVSSDYPKIYEFLGLDYSMWVKGFDELQDIFEFITKSKYFGTEMFQMENLNKINRDRNKKRKSYVAFLEYIATLPEKEGDGVGLNLAQINNVFPEANIEMRIRELEYEECKKLYVQSKFSGGEVKRRFGLEGKELGDAMTNFKTHVETFYGFDKYILEEDSEYIYNEFKYFMEQPLNNDTQL